MKNQKSAKSVLIMTSLCVVFVAAVLGIAGRGIWNSTAQDKNRDDLIALRDALRRGGLREAAKLKGNYVAEFDPHWDFGLFGLESLTKNSSAIVVGRILKRLDSRIVADGNLIFTDYEVGMEELLKGNIKQAKTIVVSLPGGRVYFEDGTSAELTTPSFDQVRIGNVYTFFLSDLDKSSNAFTLVGGPQGMVDIEDSSRVKSHGRSTDPVAAETKDKSRESFLREVRNQVRKWPAPGKCCS